MRLSEKEKAANRAAFRAMSPGRKLEHIFTYYLWLIALVLVALIVLFSVLHRQLTQKEPVLYLALVNVAVGEESERALGEGYLSAIGADPKRQEVYLYRDLYLSEDADTLNHQYAYASEMKLMGAIQARTLDLVLMNREGYDLLSQRGYLAELPLSPGQGEALSALLAENEVVLSDNSLELMLGEAAEAERITKTVPNALRVGSLPLFQNAAFDGELYLGVIANSPRSAAAETYFSYLLG